MVISSHVVAGRAPAVADTGMFRPTSTPTCYEHLNRPGTRGGYRSHCRVAVPLVHSPGVCSTACWRKTISSSMWSAEPVQGGHQCGPARLRPKQLFGGWPTDGGFVRC